MAPQRSLAASAAGREPAADWRRGSSRLASAARGKNDHVPVSIEEVRRLALTLPRSTEHLIRDRVKFRVGRLVYVAFSRDEALMGFGYPKEERDALVGTRSEVFQLPRASDLRYNWVVARLDALDSGEMRELVIDAWRMCVPKSVAANFDALQAATDTLDVQWKP